MTFSMVDFLDTGVCFCGHFSRFACQVLLMFFFLVMEMPECVVAGPQDADLQLRIMNSAALQCVM